MCRTVVSTGAIFLLSIISTSEANAEAKGNSIYLGILSCLQISEYSVHALLTAYISGDPIKTFMEKLS